jgi:hypothetical protein
MNNITIDPVGSFVLALSYVLVAHGTKELVSNE